MSEKDEALCEVCGREQAQWVGESGCLEQGGRLCLRLVYEREKARAEVWRKSASEMLAIEIDARNAERLREHFRKTEALTRDAAASGRALQPSGEDMAIVMRGRAQPPAGPSSCPNCEAAEAAQAKLTEALRAAADVLRVAEVEGEDHGDRCRGLAQLRVDARRTREAIRAALTSAASAPQAPPEEVK